jgi:cytochrome-b5 reductase
VSIPLESSTNMLVGRRRTVAIAAVGSAAALAWVWQQRQSAAQKDRLTPGQPVNCKLLFKRWVAPDAVRLQFELPSPSFSLGLPVPGHVLVVDAATNYRPYSPVAVENVGSFELLVRRYPHGEFSSQLARMEPGDQATFAGPVESRFRYRRGAAAEVGLVAAGTGITPMWQVIQAALSDPKDTTRFSLVYASSSPERILLKEELDRAAALHPERFRLCYLVSEAGTARGESGLPAGVRLGRIDGEILRTHLPPPPDSRLGEGADGACQVLVSGPERMLVELCGRRARDGGTNFGPGEQGAAMARHPALGGVLYKLGYRADQVTWL